MRLNWRNLALFLAILGPGIITASVDNDAGGITTYSIAGASFGYKLLWTMVPILIILIVVQEMCARMGVVTGKGLADLIRENFGIKTTFLMMLVLVLANLGNVVAEFAGVAASAEIFGISRYIVVPVAAAVVWWMVVKGTYKSVEKLFLIASTFYFSYLLSAVLIPDIHFEEIAVNAFRPTIEFNASYLILLIGLVGTTVAPWMQFFIQSLIVEKGVKVKDYSFTALDVVVGGLVTVVVASAIIITTAATLHANGIVIDDAAKAALALQPLAGQYAALLFAFGLFNASLFAASILPLSTAYSVCEGLGWDSGIDKKFHEAPQFYWLYTGLIAVGALVILVPGLPLIPIMFLSQVLNGMLLPFVLVFVMLLINNREIMGKYTNGAIMNLLGWGTTVLMVVLTILMVASLIRPNFLLW